MLREANQLRWTGKAQEYQHKLSTFGSPPPKCLSHDYCFIKTKHCISLLCYNYICTSVGRWMWMDFSCISVCTYTYKRQWWETVYTYKLDSALMKSTWFIRPRAWAVASKRSEDATKAPRPSKSRHWTSLPNLFRVTCILNWPKKTLSVIVNKTMQMFCKDTTDDACGHLQRYCVVARKRYAMFDLAESYGRIAMISICITCMILENNLHKA